MRFLYYIILSSYIIFFSSCNSAHNSEKSNEGEHSEASHENEIAEEHGTEVHSHGVEIKLKITCYSNDFELFAEADPFVKGETVSILSHLTYLSNFKPLENASVTATLNVKGKTTSQKLDTPERKGIYRFSLKPEVSGNGKLIYDIYDGKQSYQIVVDNITVFSDEHDAIHETEESLISSPNAITFTKEQSWKVEFGTQKIELRPMVQVIKTSAKVESSPSDEITITAKSDGVIQLSNDLLVEGSKIKFGQILMQVSGNEFADNNIKVKFIEAQSNYEKTKANHIRNLELIKDKIISDKELQQSAYEFENAKTVYENYMVNFNANGQTVTSPIIGTVRNIWVKNGQAVTAGTPLLSISKNSKLSLIAGVQAKYASDIKDIESVNIRSIEQGKTFTLLDLNGKLISIGASTSTNSYLLPITFQVDAKEELIPGSFVELYINTKTQNSCLSVPNTALIEEQGYFAVFVQLTPELFEKREVEVGSTDGFNTMIKKGLNNGERVVTKSALLVKLAAVSNSLDPHAGHVH